MADERDTRLGQLAITKGFVSASQVKDLLEFQEQLRAATGRTQQLGDLLLERELIDQAQLQELLKTQIRRSNKDIGGYTLISRLGAGGMGAVYKARQNSMDRMVALKVLPPKLAKDQSFIQRFFREARSVAQLNHLNIVQGIDVGEASGYYYFAMEFVEGSSLRDVIEERGHLSEAEALDVIEQVTRGLQHAHAHGLIHRDIKPDNVLIEKSGVAKVCDLGLARLANDDSSLTQTGVALGTPHYISPEQARGEPDVDARADLYSLGATWFHILAGSPPFTADNALAVITKHLSEPAPKVSTMRKGISRGCEAVIAKLMAKEPADRYQSAEELLNDIADLKDGQTPRGATAAGAAFMTSPTAPARVRDTRPHAPVSNRFAPRDLPDGIDLDDLRDEPVPAGPLSSRPLQFALAAGVLGLFALGTWGIRNALREPQQPLPVPQNIPTAPATPEANPVTALPGKDRLAELEKMHQHILATRNKHPGDLDLLEKRWKLLRKAGEKTKYSLIAMDELSAIASKRLEASRLKHAQDIKRFETVASAVNRLITNKRFGAALRECKTFSANPAARSPVVTRRLSALETRVAAEGRKAVLAVLGRAKQQTAKREFPAARKTLQEMSAWGLPAALPERDRALARLASAERTAVREKEQQALDRCRKVIAGLKKLVKRKQFAMAVKKLDQASKDLPRAAAEQLVAPERELLANADRFMKQCTDRAKSPPAKLRIKVQGMSFRIAGFKNGVISIKRFRMSSQIELLSMDNQQLLLLSGWDSPGSCTPAQAIATGCFLTLAGGSSAQAKSFLNKARSGGKISRPLARALAVRAKGEAEVMAEEKYAALERAYAAKQWRQSVSLAEALLKDYARTNCLASRSPRVREMLEKAQDEISPLTRYTVVLQEGLDIPQLGIAAYSGTADTFLCGVTKDRFAHGREATLKAYNFGAQAPLYRFDLSMIPREAQIDTAVLELSCASVNYGFKAGKDKLTVYALNRSWTETSASWSFCSRTSRTPWSTPGAVKDLDTASNWGLGAGGKAGTFTCEPGKAAQTDISRLVTAWIAGKKANHGVYIKVESGGIVYFRSKEAAPALRPKLTITFKSKRLKTAAAFAFHPREATVYRVEGSAAAEAFKRAFRINKFSTRRGDKSAVRLRSGQLEFDAGSGDLWMFWTPALRHTKDFSASLTIDCSSKKPIDSGHVAFGFSLNDSSGIDGRSALICRADASRKSVRHYLLENMVRGFRQKPLFSANSAPPNGKLFGTYLLRISWKSPTLAWFINGKRVGIVKLASGHATRMSQANFALLAGMFSSRSRDQSVTLKISRIAVGKSHELDFKNATSIPTLKEPDLRTLSPRPPRHRPPPPPTGGPRGPVPPPVGL
jgi:eukaryotic-like serine/threonine-protein kinase